jgi:prophage regulatory protein
MRLIRLKEVKECTGLGRSSIYKFMTEGHFPKSISLGERAVAWELGEIEEWMLSKIESRNKAIDEFVEVEAEIEVSEGDVIKFIKDKFNHLSISDAIAWLMQIYK